MLRYQFSKSIDLHVSDVAFPPSPIHLSFRKHPCCISSPVDGVFPALSNRYIVVAHTLGSIASIAHSSRPNGKCQKSAASYHRSRRSIPISHSAGQNYLDSYMQFELASPSTSMPSCTLAISTSHAPIPLGLSSHFFHGAHGRILIHLFLLDSKNSVFFTLPAYLFG